MSPQTNLDDESSKPVIKVLDASKDANMNVFSGLGREDLIWLAGMFEAEAYYYVDERKRSQSNSVNYTPPPGTPGIKFEYTQKETAERIALFVGQEVKVQKRLTTAGKTVYRVTVCARAKTELILKALLPFTVGLKTKAKMQELLVICEKYNLWVAEQGKKKAAQLANKASQRKKTN